MKGYQKFNLFLAVLVVTGILVAAAPDDAPVVVPPTTPVVIPPVVVDAPIANDEVQYHALIIKEYHALREIMLNDPDKLTVRPMSLPAIQAWRARVNLLGELGYHKQFIGIYISNDVAVNAYELDNLLFAYIQEKEIKEWETKFESAVACTEKPKSCEKYRRHLSEKEEKELLKFMK